MYIQSVTSLNNFTFSLSGPLLLNSSDSFTSVKNIQFIYIFICEENVVLVQS